MFGYKLARRFSTSVGESLTTGGKTSSTTALATSILANSYNGLLGALGLSVGAIGAYVLMSKESKESNLNFNKEQVEDVQYKSLEVKSSEKQKLIEEAYQSQNPMKSFPIGQKNWNSMDSVVDYTIYGDLKFYNLNSSYFYKDLEEMTYLDHKKIEKRPLTGIRQNHMTSLAIEAERSLQNIFIRAEDLRKTIKEQGYFECPGVFMRYKGFVYFRHRSKPIVMKDIENIPNNQQLSLFDIFHRYYSPLPEVNDEYFEFILTHGGYIQDTTTLENSSWIGNVTFNHRSIPKLLIKGDEKNVFMWRGKNQDEPQESRYIKIWNPIHIIPAEPPIAYDTAKFSN